MLPQFHVNFDDYFTTVPFLATGDIPPKWEELVQASESAKYWLASNVRADAEDLSNQEGDSDSKTDARTKVSSVDEFEKSKNTEALLQPTLPGLNEMTRR